MASESWRGGDVDAHEGSPPRISLSEGLSTPLNLCADSAHRRAPDAGGSSYSSPEFEFLTVPFCLFAPSHLPPLPPPCSMSSPDQLFCNGRILPLDQTRASPHIRSEDRGISEGRRAAADEDAGVSRRLKDMLKLDDPKQRKVESKNWFREKNLPAAARSLWFLRRCRSANDKEDPYSRLRTADPCLDRSASDSKTLSGGAGSGEDGVGGDASRQAFGKPHIKPFARSDSFRGDGGGGDASRLSFGKPHTKSPAKSDSFRSYTRKGSPHRQRPAESRVSLKNPMKDSRWSRESQDHQLLRLDQRPNLPQKARDQFARSKSQRPSGRQAPPVVGMQICMAHSFLTLTARPADRCNPNILKKQRAQKAA